MKKIYLLLFPLLAAPALYGQTKFIPQAGEVYVVKSTTNNGPSGLYKLNTYTNQTTTLKAPMTVNGSGSTTMTINAVAMNPKDSLIYGIEANSNNLVKIGAGGNITPVALLSGTLPVENYQSADFDTAGNLYLHANTTTLYKIRIENMNATSVTTITIPSRTAQDIAVSPNGSKLYIKRNNFASISEMPLGTNTEIEKELNLVTNVDYLMAMDDMQNLIMVNVNTQRMDYVGAGNYSTKGTLFMGSTNPIYNSDIAYFRVPLIHKEIPCDEYLYQVIGDGVSSKLVKYNHFTNDSVLVADLGQFVNSLAYYPQKGLFYATINSTDSIMMISESGLKTISEIPGLNGTLNYNAGDIDTAGYYYLLRQNVNQLYCIDVNPNRATYLQLVNPSNNFTATSTFIAMPSTLNIADWAVNPINNNLYSVGGNFVYIYDQYSNTINTSPLTGSTSNTNSAYGGVFFDGNGYLYCFENTTGLYHRIDVSTAPYNSIRVNSNGTPNNNNDGASCSQQPTFETDLGDAPHDYKTLLTNQGALHIIKNGLSIGATVTKEDDATPHALANTDVDDGIIGNLPPLSDTTTSYSIQVEVTNATGSPATLNAWLDFNRNLEFELSERVSITTNNSGTYTLTWNNLSGVIGGDTYLRLRLAHNATEIDNPTGNASSGEVEDYLVNIEATSLAIDLANFNAVASESNALLNWVTYNSDEITHFEVQHSMNGRDFKTVANIQSEAALNKYYFEHQMELGQNYYRIKINGLDNTTKYSKIKTLYYNNLNPVKLYPNPVYESLIINQGAAVVYTRYQIVDLLGRVVLNGNLTSVNQTLNTSNLVTGVYYIQLQNEHTTIVEKFTKN